MTSQDQLPHITTVKDRAKSKLERDAREILFALQDPETVEIMVNADGRIWQEKLGQKIQHIGNIQAAQVEAVIKTVAGFHGKEVNRFNPMIEGEFPLDNSRFAGQLPPIVSSPTFAIRKKAIKIFTLERRAASSEELNLKEIKKTQISGVFPNGIEKRIKNYRQR